MLTQNKRKIMRKNQMLSTMASTKLFKIKINEFKKRTPVEESPAGGATAIVGSKLIVAAMTPLYIKCDPGHPITGYL